MHNKLHCWAFFVLPCADEFIVNVINFTKFQRPHNTRGGLLETCNGSAFHPFIICGFPDLRCCSTTLLVLTREFAIQAMLSQFDKRDGSENRRRDSNNMSLGEILAIVIAALTLLVAMVPLFRCSRFRRWVSSSISPFFKVYQLPALSEPIHI